MSEYRFSATRAERWFINAVAGLTAAIIVGNIAPRYAPGAFLFGVWAASELQRAVSLEYDSETGEQCWVVDTGPSLREEYRSLRAWIDRRRSSNDTTGDTDDV